VLLPALAGSSEGHPPQSAPRVLGDGVGVTLALTVAKVAAFVALVLVVGTRLVPWLLEQVARTDSRELFTLSVLATALGIAYGSAELFGVSFALGAFFAGMVLAESELSQQAAAESLPLRDAFAVLFFVSVGMLFDPLIVLRDPLAVIAALAIVWIGNAGVGLLIMRALRQPLGTGLLIGASLAQIGEFSFILAGLGMSLGLLPEAGRDLILAVAIISILVNPAFFAAIDHVRSFLERRVETAGPGVGGETPAAEEVASRALPVTTLSDHAVVVGYGRVGGRVGEALLTAGLPLLAIEDNEDIVKQLHSNGVEVITGNAAAPESVHAANLGRARWLFVAVPNAFEAGQIIEQARGINPTLPIIARAHSDAEVDYLQKLGANVTIMGEREIADAMVEHALGTPPAPRSRIDGAQAPKPAATTEPDPEAVAGAVAAGDG
jgi:K+:H+ antiporter